MAPPVPRLLGITEKPGSDGKKLKPIEKYGIKTMSIGFLVKEDEAMIWRGPMVQSALTQMMSDVPGRRWMCWCWTCRRAPAMPSSPSPSACR